jgi:dienelactone hydrolase
MKGSRPPAKWIPGRAVALVTLIVLAAVVPGALAGEREVAVQPVSLTSGALTLRAVLGRPVGDGPFPAYISNHGSMTVQDAARGPWTGIVKGSLPDTLMRDGWVVLVLARRGYRGSEGSTTTYTTNETSQIPGKTARDVMRGAEAESGDVVAALDYLASLPYVDRERVAVGGVSLGGLVSLMAAARDPRFKAVVSMAGGYAQTDGGRSVGGDAAWPLLDETWKDVATKITAPVLLLWSKNDMTIKTDTGRVLEKYLRQAGKPVEMKLYPAYADNGHYLFSRGDGYPVFVPDSVRFLDAQLVSRPSSR